MAIPQGQLSSVLVDGTFLSPEGGVFQPLSDIESGPIDVEDTSQGLDYQDWIMTWAGGTFTLTPQTVGAPSTPLTGISNVARFTFTFDQNGRVYIAWETTTPGQSSFWWYDTLAAAKVTTDLTALYGGNVYSPRCHLDDRRQMQFANNDILLFYTMDSATTGYEMFMGIQRERFQIQNSLADEILYKNIHRCGMHDGLRIKLTLGVL
jgi:hypothetical protein